MRGPGKLFLLCVVVAGLVLLLATMLSMKPAPSSLADLVQVARKNVYLDRNGRPLNVTYENHWNLHEVVKLHELPEFLVSTILRSEDKRFFEHTGIDWLARLNAARQNLLAGEVVRGASTITEQVVRMIRPRPRTIWSRWLEGFEAMALENRFSKLDILEFY
ncbi:MAG: transglycosylase domain-containing protein, partial [Planctomycetaceae bacterium]|nr:transglycosylase domain-containing protein [Planctomycetaceae bacterium]